MVMIFANKSLKRERRNRRGLTRERHEVKESDPGKAKSVSWSRKRKWRRKNCSK